MGCAQGGSSAGSGGNAVRYDLYRETTGNWGAVGSVATNICSMRKRDSLQGGGGLQERGMVALGGVR